MNTRKLSVPLTGNGSAVLILPDRMTGENLHELERSLTAELARLQRDGRVAAADPGQIEYASWLQQPGAVHH
jgi:hypothetical protein